MKRMATSKKHELRITTLEELAHGHGESLYQLKRTITKHDLRLKKILTDRDITDVADDEVDKVLDEE